MLLFYNGNVVSKTNQSIFVEHLEEYKIAGKLYAPNMTAPGAVKDLEVFQEAYAMGYAL